MKDESKNNLERAYGYAIYLLSLKLRTEGELIDKLKVKGYKPEIITELIKRLVENKYINDARYAEVYLDNLKKYKNFGYYGIKKKLMEKKLPSGIIENILAEGLSLEDEQKIAKRFLSKNKFENKNKTAQRLKSRGFRIDIITKLLFLFYCFFLPIHKLFV